MKRFVKHSEVNGDLIAPASKSVAQRAIAIASLAHGQSEVLHPGHCDDVEAAIGVCRALGARIERIAGGLSIEGGISTPKQPLNCNEAGLSIRMFAAIAATLSDPVTLTGGGSLANRPMGIVEESLAALGVKCRTANGYIPITVQGPLPGGHSKVDGSLSSQVLTGILIASPLAKSDVRLTVSNLQSQPYIDVTTDVMGAFGVAVVNNSYEEFTIKSKQEYKPTRFTVEGDWSGAAFLLVAGAIGGSVRVSNLHSDSRQADRAILDALRLSGAGIRISGTTVEVYRAPLRAFTFDATHCPDLFPPLVSLATYSKGTTIIKGVSRLRVKESDRAATLMEEFGKLGVRITIHGEDMAVEGNATNGGTVHSHGDHRIAMATAIAALPGTGVVEIINPEAVAKSYPEFFEDLERISFQG